MKEEFEGEITSDSYVCNAGFWTTDYHIESEKDFEDILKQFGEGKKIKVTIEEIL